MTSEGVVLQNGAVQTIIIKNMGEQGIVLYDYYKNMGELKSANF